MAAGVVMRCHHPAMFHGAKTKVPSGTAFRQRTSATFGGSRKIQLPLKVRPTTQRLSSATSTTSRRRTPLLRVRALSDAEALLDEGRALYESGERMRGLKAFERALSQVGPCHSNTSTAALLRC